MKTQPIELDKCKCGVNQHCEPKGIKFFSQYHQKEMILVTETGCWEHWLVYKHPDGQWVSLHKAGENEVNAIAVGKGWKLVDGAPFQLWTHKDCFCHEGDTCKGHQTIELWELLPNF